MNRGKKVELILKYYNDTDNDTENQAALSSVRIFEGHVSRLTCEEAKDGTTCASH